MSKYTANPFVVNQPQAAIVEKFSDLTAMQPMLDKLPEEQRKQVENITLEKDSIGINTPQLGQVKFKVESLRPDLVQMKAQGAPVPMALEVALKPIDADSTEAVCGIDIDLPAMLRPMVAPHLNKAVEMLAEVMKKTMG